MVRVILITFLFSWTSVDAFAQQQFLYLKKLGGKREVRFFRGEEIRFQLKGDPHFVTGTIEDFGENYLVVFGTEVYLENIARIDIKSKKVSWFSFESSTGTMLMAGLALPIVDVANQLITEKEGKVNLHPSVIIVSAVLVTASLILKLLEPKYFVLGEKRTAVIVGL